MVIQNDLTAMKQFTIIAEGRIVKTGLLTRILFSLLGFFKKLQILFFWSK